VRDARVSGRGIQPGLVWLPRAYCPLHFIIDFQDDPLGSVFPVAILVFIPQYSVRIKYVLNISVISSIEQEKHGIKFAFNQEST
jgi:hypothetical protein